SAMAIDGVFRLATKSASDGVFSMGDLQIAANAAASAAMPGAAATRANASEALGSAKSLARNTIASSSDFVLAQMEGSALSAFNATRNEIREKRSRPGPKGFLDLRPGCWKLR